ncbi:hypothetical protein D3C85_1077540 [compost metagenome]|jgi:uncharacterized protein (DUF4415 family)
MADKSMSGEWVELWLDAEIVVAFRAAGLNWRELMHVALTDWLKTHTPTVLQV